MKKFLVLISLTALMMLACDDNDKDSSGNTKATTSSNDPNPAMSNRPVYFRYEQGQLCLKEGEQRKGCYGEKGDDEDDGYEAPWTSVTYVCMRDAVDSNTKKGALKMLEEYQKERNTALNNPFIAYYYDFGMIQEWNDMGLNLGWKVSSTGETCNASCNVITGECVSLALDDGQACDWDKRETRCDGNVLSWCDDIVKATDCAWTGGVCVPETSDEETSPTKTDCQTPCQNEGRITNEECYSYPSVNENGDSIEVHHRAWIQCVRSGDKLYYKDKDEECKNGCTNGKCN